MTRAALSDWRRQVDRGSHRLRTIASLIPKQCKSAAEPDRKGLCVVCPGTAPIGYNGLRGPR